MNLNLNQQHNKNNNILSPKIKGFLDYFNDFCQIKILTLIGGLTLLGQKSGALLMIVMSKIKASPVRLKTKEVSVRYDL